MKIKTLLNPKYKMKQDEYIKTEIPDELTTEDILKLSNKIKIQEWEEWLLVKWKRVKE